MPFYIKLPIPIEAIRLPKTDEIVTSETFEFINKMPTNCISEKDGSLAIPTLEGVMVAEPGDYIIKGIQGEFYPCKPDIFLSSYAEHNNVESIMSEIGNCIKGGICKKECDPKSLLTACMKKDTDYKFVPNTLEMDNPEREPWNNFWMDRAIHVATRSTCKSGRKVGAIFVRDNIELVFGFNGVPTKYPHPISCTRRDLGLKSGEGLDKCPCAHAEMNGIANATKNGISLKDSTLYTTTYPCAMCMPILANAGIKEIIYLDVYSHPITESIAEYADVVLVKFVK